MEWTRRGLGSVPGDATGDTVRDAERHPMWPLPECPPDPVECMRALLLFLILTLVWFQPRLHFSMAVFLIEASQSRISTRLGGSYDRVGSS